MKGIEGDLGKKKKFFLLRCFSAKEKRRFWKGRGVPSPLLTWVSGQRLLGRWVPGSGSVVNMTRQKGGLICSLWCVSAPVWPRWYWRANRPTIQGRKEAEQEINLNVKEGGYAV